MVVIDKYEVPSSDTGDVFTVASYDSDRFSKDIPDIGIDGIRASDTLDFRPRVSTFDASTADKSPFDFTAGTTAFNSSLTSILAPNEVSTLSYDYYLPELIEFMLTLSETL